MSATAGIAADKTMLRAMLRDRRRRFVAALGDARAPAEARIAARAHAALGGAHRVALYVAQGAEVDPVPLLAALAAEGRITALPFTATRGAPPEFRRWTPGGTLAEGPFGVRQPDASSPRVEPDAIVAPLLGFDVARFRLGQGAGWYDRAFAASPGALRIGLAWSAQAADPLPRDPWDLPLDAILTEEGGVP